MRLIKTTRGVIVMIAPERKFKFYLYMAEAFGGYCFLSETWEDIQYLRKYLASKGIETELTGGDVPCYCSISGFKIRSDLHLLANSLGGVTLMKITEELRKSGYFTTSIHDRGFEIIR